MNKAIEQDFYLREQVALGVHSLSRTLRIPTQWLVENAVQTLLNSQDGPVRSSLKQAYAKAMREATAHDAFDDACKQAVEGMKILVEYERPGWRYEAVAFKGDKLVVVSASFPLKRGQKLTPKEITLLQSVEWAARRAAEREEALPDCFGNFANEARWLKLLAAQLKGRAAR